MTSRLISSTKEGSTIKLEATYTDVNGSPVNPLTVNFTTYRNVEPTPVQVETAATLTDNVAVMIVSNSLVRVADGEDKSLYRIEYVAAFADGQNITDIFEQYVINLRSLT